VSAGAAPLLEAHDLIKHFPVGGGLAGGRRQVVHAVDGVSISVGRGETLALVGESGCGKTTLGRAVLRLHEPSAGTLRFAGENFLALAGPALRAARRRMQMIFQDPQGSLNPRMIVGDIVAEPLDVHRLCPTRAQRRERVIELLGRVGLPPESFARHPHEFSGGQRQRIGIARALAAGPELVVADEPISALDVSIQAQIVNLLGDLQVERGLAYLFVSHDLRVVRYLAHRVAVMYLGRIVETGPTTQVYEWAAHPYTRALLSAVPRADPGTRRLRVILEGDPPSPITPPPGCSFHPRCPIYAKLADARCRTERPELAPAAASGHTVACHHPDG
jgi:oligopeptide/dipeptide ABC transporter ATP-binding protein